MGKAKINQSTVAEASPLRADWLQGPPQGHWTYDDYAALPEDGNRYELINGVIYMSPSPNFWHQSASIRFSAFFLNQVEFVGLRKVIAAPFDVELEPGNTVQPDIIVLLNEHLERLLPGKIMGAPDLVVEIASPGTASYDRTDKQNAYAQAGVSEYWIADPTSQTIEVLLLENAAYRSLGIFQEQDTLPSQIVPNLPVRVAQFFA